MSVRSSQGPDIHETYRLLPLWQLKSLTQCPPGLRVVAVGRPRESLCWRMSAPLVGQGAKSGHNKERAPGRSSGPRFLTFRDSLLYTELRDLSSCFLFSSPRKCLQSYSLFHPYSTSLLVSPLSFLWYGRSQTPVLCIFESLLVTTSAWSQIPLSARKPAP